MTLALPAWGVAQDAGPVVCDGDPVRAATEAFPAVGATNVTTDAPLRLRYSEGYFGPGGPGGDPTTLIQVLQCPATPGTCIALPCMDNGTFVPGRASVLGDELVFLPDGGWETGTGYAGVARGADRDFTFQFCTGNGTDTAAPVLGPIDRVTSDPVEPRCDAPTGGFRVAVFFRPATDTGPPGSIEYLLFQTRGVGIEGAVLRDRARNFPTEQVSLAFVLPPEQATGPVCLRVVAVDGVGNLDLSDAESDAETCLDPVQGNYFYPLCSLSRGRTPDARFGGLALTALAVVLVRRRARRQNA